MGAPVDFPSNIPDKNSGSSVSLRSVVRADWPGLRRAICRLIRAKSIAIPAGNPSITPPIAFPCDSPNVVSRNILPNVLLISANIRFHNLSTNMYLLARCISLCTKEPYIKMKAKNPVPFMPGFSALNVKNALCLVKLRALKAGFRP